MNNVLNIVHCIDTEGPLNESIEDSFIRLFEYFDIRLRPTKENFSLLFNSKLDKTYGKNISSIFNSKTLNYNRTLKELKLSLSKILSTKFRSSLRDDFDNPWIYSWFCVAHKDCDSNPRSKMLGTHAIFDLYTKLKGLSDDIQFHYHPLSYSKDSSDCATGWLYGRTNLVDILARRLIDRNWFPSVNRPGFHVTRPDSHWFLEQFIPFDFANQKQSGKKLENLSEKHLSDWSRAPNSWVPYHPRHDDWQRIGDSRRVIGRCLNIGTRHSLLRKKDVEQAFQEVRDNKRAILAFTNHDFRDMSLDIEETYKLIRTVQSENYRDIKIKYIKASDAIRFYKGKKSHSIKLEADLDQETGLLSINSDKNTFGIQPFFAYLSKSNHYYHDNLQIIKPYRKWIYLFDRTNVEIHDLKKIALATNSNSGVTSIIYSKSLKANSWKSKILNF